MSPDGKYLAFGDSQGTLYVWGVTDGSCTELTPLSSHSKTINSLSFSPDGKYLASGSKDGTVKVFQATGNPFHEIKPLTGHKKGVHSVLFSPKGTFFVSGGSDNLIRIWKLNGVGEKTAPETKSLSSLIFKDATENTGSIASSQNTSKSQGDDLLGLSEPCIVVTDTLSGSGKSSYFHFIGLEEIYSVKGIWDKNSSPANQDSTWYDIELHVKDKNLWCVKERNDVNFVRIVVPKALKDSLISAQPRIVELTNLLWHSSESTTNADQYFYVPEKVEGIVSAISDGNPGTCDIDHQTIAEVPHNILSLLREGDQVALYVWKGKFLATCPSTLVKDLANRRLKEGNQYALGLKTGTRPINDINDAVIALDATIDLSYTSGPPIDGPTSEQEYFIWSGNLARKDGNIYLVWNPSDKAGFAFTNVKKMFSTIQANRSVFVVGRYVENIQITLVSGEAVVIPLLTDCYVSSESVKTEDDTDENTYIKSSTGFIYPVKGKDIIKLILRAM